MKKTILLMVLLTALWQCGFAQAQDGDIVWTKWTHNIARLQFSNDDSKILTVGSGGIIIFDTQTGEQIKQLPGKGIYSDDGTMIISLREMNIDVYNAETYQLIKTIPLTVSGVYTVLLSPDGKFLVASGLKFVQFIDFHTGNIIHYLNKFGDENRDVEITSDLITKDSKYYIIALWDPVKGSYGSMMFINTSNYQMDYKYNKRVGGGLAISNDGQYIAFNSIDESGKAVTIMNTQTKEIVGHIPGNATAVTSIAFSPDGKYIAVSDQNLTTTLFQISDLNSIKQFTPGRAFIGLDISINNQYLIGGIGKIIQLFKLLPTGITSEEEIAQVLYPNPASNSVNLSFDLPAPAEIQFNLYDISGGLIANLKSGFYSAGHTEENFNTSELSGGTYYLKIESLHFNKTYKLIINR